MQFGTILLNSICWKMSRVGSLSTSGTTSFGLDPVLLPHLLRQEPVAHAHGGLERELLAVLHLGVGHAVVDLLEREHAEGT